MKEVFTELSLDSLEILALTFEFDIDIDSDIPKSYYQDIPQGPDSDRHIDLKNSQYKRPFPISDRLASHHASLFPFECA